MRIAFPFFHRAVFLLSLIALHGSPLHAEPLDGDPIQLLGPDLFHPEELFTEKRDSPPKQQADIQSNIHALFQYRLDSLHLRNPGATSLFSLCRAMKWEKGLPCELLDKNHTKYSLEKFWAAQKKVFAIPHPIRRTLDNLRADCTRHTLLESPIPFLEEQKEFPLKRLREHPNTYTKFFLENPSVTELEIWTGPRGLLDACLNQLGYRLQPPLEKSTWEEIRLAEFQGKTRLLLLGPHEWSWIYEVERQIIQSQGQIGRTLHSSVLSPFSNPEDFYRDLAEVWYFYALGRFQEEAPNTVIYGYGPAVGTGKRFFDQYFQKSFPECRGASEELPIGLRFSFDGDKTVQFLQSTSADVLTIPAYVLGQLLAKKGVQQLGLWGTAGGISGLQVGDIYVPQAFSGFPFSFFTDSLQPSSQSIPNAMYAQVLSPQQGLVSGGLLGSIFHAALENTKVEELMSTWNWRAVDTDSFFLFSGFLSKKKSLKTFAVFWITDTSSQVESAPETKSTFEKRNDESVSRGQQLLGSFLSLQKPRCSERD